MNTRRRQSSKGNAADSGADWAAHKLGVLASYLVKYTTILQQKALKKAYIDGFANTEYRSLRRGESCPALAQSSPQAWLEGSARLALKTHPRFDRYLFLGRHAQHNLRLEGLKLEFSDRAADIRIADGDANQALSALCDRDWHHRRAVLFLDPFGMQIEWSTIEALGRTKAIDLWLLLPLGLGLPQLMTEVGGMAGSWRAKVDQLLGGRGWYEDFRTIERPSTWTRSDEEHVAVAAKDAIGRRLGERLIRVFAGVAGPVVLMNTEDRPLYLVCFAAGNPRNVAVGLRHAGQLLDAMGEDE